MLAKICRFFKETKATQSISSIKKLKIEDLWKCVPQKLPSSLKMCVEAELFDFFFKKKKVLILCFKISLNRIIISMP